MHMGDRLLALLAVVLVTNLQALQVADARPRLYHTTGDLYPRSPTDPRFVLGFLADGGCSPLYIESPREGCALIRGEPAWVDVGVGWTGPRPLRLQPTSAAFLSLVPRRAPRGATWSSLKVRWQPGPGQERAADGSFEIAAGRGLSFRVDLAGLTRSLPAGPYVLCFVPNLTPPPGVRWDSGAQDACYRFELFEDDSTPARLEALRRRAVELVGAARCREAGPVIDAMMALDAGSAAAYRLRGIVAELERRQFDAIADYAQASHLLRTGGDRHLPLQPDTRAAFADELDDWRIGLELAQGLSLLDPEGSGSMCR
jgi:hypothetical protein